MSADSKDFGGLRLKRGFTLEEYRDMVTAVTCRWCGAPLPETVLHYPHADGWLVHGLGGLQWLYVRCPRCDYDWAIWKLGVPRFPPVLNEQEKRQ